MTDPTDLTEAKRLVEAATPGPWHLCQHLKSVEDDAACRCGYRGAVFGPDHDIAYAVFQPGHELPRDEEQWGSEPARYDRPTEIANAQLIVWMRNNLPTLIAAHEAALRENEALREVLGEIADYAPGVTHGWADAVRHKARALLADRS